MNSQFFLCIGAQKAGTTWLAGYLRDHPQCFMSTPKELHYFESFSDAVPEGIDADAANRRWAEKLRELSARESFQNGKETSPEFFDRLEGIVDRLRMTHGIISYEEFFRKRVQVQHKIFGEISPSYSLLTIAGMERIRRTYSDARIIFLMRDPVERVWSNILFRKLKSTKLDPHKVISSLEAENSIIARTRYDITIENMRSVFREEQIHLEFYEELFHKNSVKKICHFLGIDYEPADFSVNPNPTTTKKTSKLDDADKQKLRRLLEPVYSYVRTNFKNIPSSWNV